MTKFWQPIGSVLFLTTTWLSLGILFLIMLICAWFPARWRFELMQQWGKITRFFLWLFCGIRVKVLGREHLPKKPCVFFVKHQSTFETFILPGLLPQHVYVIKKELLNVPFFGWCLRLFKSIAVDRDQGMKSLKAVMSQGKTRLNEGFSIVIFPEGTRVQVGENPAFHKSGVLLARGVGCDIVPIAHNAGMLWPKHHFVKRRGVVTVDIGAAIASHDFTLESLTHHLHAWMVEHMAVLESKSSKE